MPTIYNQVGFCARCPNLHWSTANVHPPYASGNSPGRGNPASFHNNECAGCSRIPPKVRTYVTASGARPFKVASGVANSRNLPHCAHGGCAMHGIPPGHKRASRSLSHASTPYNRLYTEVLRTNNAAIIILFSHYPKNDGTRPFPSPQRGITPAFYLVESKPLEGGGGLAEKITAPAASTGMYTPQAS